MTKDRWRAAILEAVANAQAGNEVLLERLAHMLAEAERAQEQLLAQTLRSEEESR